MLNGVEKTMFKIGDIVQLEPKTRTFGANEGALAKVIRTEINVIYVEWLDKNTSYGQQNGDYDSIDFILFKERKKEIKPFGIVSFCKTFY